MRARSFAPPVHWQAARLFHVMIAANWLQCEAPLFQKGGRLLHIVEPGCKLAECAGQRDIMINGQSSSVNGRLLRPKLLAFMPNLVKSSQAVGSMRRESP